MTERRADLEIFDSPALLAEAVADAFVDCARSAVENRGAFFVALAGGTTPKAAYALLAAPPRRDAVDWQRTHVFFGDERCVAPSSGQSNFRMASEALLDAVRVPRDHVYRMHGEDEPQFAADAYAAVLRSRLGSAPVFDLLLLGMGPDGHTASLFPGTDPLTDNDRLVRAPYVEKLQQYRLTVTPLVLNHAREIVIAAEGDAKAAALKAVLEGPRNPVEHPIAIVAPESGHVRWMVDRRAAALLQQPRSTG